MASELLDLRVSFRGQSLPVWRYDSVPDGMCLARTTDLYMGRPVLYQVMIGPDKGMYYTDYVRPTVYRTLIDRINAGHPVYVQGQK